MGLLTVNTATTSNDLITLDDLPGSLRGASSTNDPRLGVLIERVSRAIPRYLGRVLARQTYQEDLPGFGGTTLKVMNTQTSEGLFPGGPLSALASVYLLQSENSTSGATQSTNVHIQDRMAGELYKQDGWDWTAQTVVDLVSRIKPDSERPLWRVTYTAGWTLPRVGVQDQTQEGNLPFDIRQAAVDTVTMWFSREQRDPTVSRRRIGDVEIQYDTRSGSDNQVGISESAVELLEPYRRLPW